MEQRYEPVWQIMINSGVYDDLKGTIDIHCHPNPDFFANDCLMTQI